MKPQFAFLRMDKISKVKRKITAALLIFAMAAASIAVSGSDAQAMMTGAIVLPCYVNPKSGYDTYITFYCPSFIVRDTAGSVLFEMKDDTITQQDMGRVTYTPVPRSSVAPESWIEYLENRSQILTSSPFLNLPNDLYIKGCTDFTITCTCANSVETYTPACETYRFELCTTSAESTICLSIPNTKISVSGSEISVTRPTTKLQWDKIKEADRYEVFEKYQTAPDYKSDGTMVATGRSLGYTKKTSYTVPCNKGMTYQISAQKLVNGEWKHIRFFEILILEDEVNIEIPTVKLRWNKVKGAKKYAVLEELHSEQMGEKYYVMGGIPFAYTKKTSYTVRTREGRTYQIWAKVKGKWKTIDTIQVTAYS